MKAYGLISLAALACAVSSAINAQTERTPRFPSEAVSFSSTEVALNTNNLSEILAADADGDGDIDVFSIERFNDSVVFLENENGRFTRNIVNSDINNVNTMFSIDLDDDGDLDLIVSNDSFTGTIAWLENDGDANYTQRNIDTNVPRIQAIFATDIDGDGDRDIVTGGIRRNVDDGIIWFENDGSEFFTRHNIGANFDSSEFISVADVDGDNDMDIISFRDFDNNFALLENDGGENFTRRFINTNTNIRNDASLEDLDGDGDIDIVAAGNSGRAFWLENNGSGLFSSREVENLSCCSDLLSVDIVDVDGDGDKDILSGRNSSDGIAWFENDGNQNFQSRIVDTGDIEDTRVTQQLSVIDADGDGDVDFFAPNANARSIMLFENAFRFNFVTDENVSSVGEVTAEGEDVSYTLSGVDAQVLNVDESGVISFNLSPNFEAPLDADTDNVFDVVLTAAEGGQSVDAEISITVNDATEGPLFQAAIPVFSRNNIVTDADQPRVVVATDIEGNGVVDLITANENSTSLNWLQNNGSESFSQQTISSNFANARAIVATDIDQDNDIDVLAVTENSSRISLFANNGNERFTQTSNFGFINDIQSLFTIDIDADGDTDVVSISDTSLNIHRNSGNQSFGSTTIDNEIVGGQSVYAIDIDGDEDIDLVTASRLDNTVAWFQNDGEENFRRRDIANDVAGARSVFAIDIDADGDSDVLVASEFDDSITLFENTVSSNFERRLITNEAIGAMSVRAIDVDNDGDLDVVSASSGDDTIAWYENDGNKNFTKHDVAADADFAIDAFPVDIDNDGDIDIATASFGDNTVAWFESTPTFSFTVVEGSQDPVITRAVPAVEMETEDVVTYTLNGDDSELFTIDEQGNLNFVEIPDFENPADTDEDNIYNLSVTASFGGIDIEAPVEVTVSNVNDAPTISGIPATSVVEGDGFSFAPEALDTDGDTLTYSIENRPSWAVFNEETGTLAGTPGAADVGTVDDIVISVSDGNESVSLPPFSLTVSAAPVVATPTPSNNSSSGGGSASYLSLLLLAVLGFRNKERSRKHS